MSEDQSLEATPTSTTRNLRMNTDINVWKKLKKNMVSPNGNHEDKDNKGNIEIPSTTSTFECKMLEYMATQTQTLQEMTQTMVNIH
jgi:hypothetical protein